MAKQILTQVGKEVAGDLTIQSREEWSQLQRKYRLEDAQTESMVSIVANDNWVEFTLRYVVEYKKRRTTKTDLFTQILNQFEATRGEVSFASATFELVESSPFNKKDQEIKGKTDL